MRNAVESVGFPKDCIALVKDTSRQSATELMQLSDYLDVLIPVAAQDLFVPLSKTQKYL